MFPKKQRISKKSPIFNSKSGVFGLYNRINTLKTKDEIAKVSIIIPKKVIKSAYGRNSLKRHLYHYIKPLFTKVKNKEMAIFIKGPLPKDLGVLDKDVDESIKKALNI